MTISRSQSDDVIRYESTRYSAAHMTAEALDVHVFLIDICKNLSDSAAESDYGAYIVGKQRIVFGAAPKTQSMILFPFFGVHEHDDV